VAGKIKNAANADNIITQITVPYLVILFFFSSVFSANFSAQFFLPIFQLSFFSQFSAPRYFAYSLTVNKLALFSKSDQLADNQLNGKISRS
jgi:protein-S-isoprenylcysteine O-methyltransferase Ste14